MKSFILACLMALGVSAHASTAVLILNQATATGAGEVQRLNDGMKVFQVTGKTSSGSGSLVIKLQCSMTGISTDWIDVITSDTITLSTVQTTQAQVWDAPYKLCRANVVTLTGTGAKASAHVGM